jgi:hypothetical protein
MCACNIAAAAARPTDRQTGIIIISAFFLRVS